MKCETRIADAENPTSETSLFSIYLLLKHTVNAIRKTKSIGSNNAHRLQQRTHIAEYPNVGQDAVQHWSGGLPRVKARHLMHTKRAQQEAYEDPCPAQSAELLSVVGGTVYADRGLNHEFRTGVGVKTQYNKI